MPPKLGIFFFFEIPLNNMPLIISAVDNLHQHFSNAFLIFAKIKIDSFFDGKRY